MSCQTLFDGRKYISTACWYELITILSRSVWVYRILGNPHDKVFLLLEEITFYSQSTGG